MKKFNLPAILENGTLSFDKELFIRNLNQLPNGMVTLSVMSEPIINEFKNRSLQQNAMYWGLIVKNAVACFTEADGREYSALEAHERLKLECNYTYSELYNKFTGEFVISRVPLSTANLSTLEMSVYFEKCVLFLNEFFNCEIILNE